MGKDGAGTGMVDNELLQQRSDQVLRLTINRPERRNALSPAVVEGITQAIRQADEDRELRAIVITATGDKAFCAGADLQTGKSFKFDYARPQLGYANMLRAARASHVPLVAYVNGACMAGGMGLMAMCDLVVAAPHVKFGLPEVKVGIFPAQVLSVLQSLLPSRVLNEMCLTGRSIDAQKALQLGLINEIDDDGAALDRLLNDLCSVSGVAQRRGLYTLKNAEALNFEQAMAFTESQIALFAQTEDAREGLAAFREKRPPVWVGR